MITRMQQRLEYFDRAYARFIEAYDRHRAEPTDHVVMAGLIQTYEFTLELAWKTLKDYLESQGYEVHGGRDAIREAVTANLDIDGRIWLEAIDDRNEIAHTYNEDIAQKVTAKIQSHYKDMLDQMNTLLHFLANDKHS